MGSHCCWWLFLFFSCAEIIYLFALSINVLRVPIHYTKLNLAQVNLGNAPVD